jgi:CheY-like chemotaxis protein
MTAKNSYPTMKPANEPFQYQMNLLHRVLVVEDNDVILRVNTEVLARCGYDVNVAENGLVAWDALQSNNYDLLLTDNDMPEWSGLELLQKLYATRTALPVILASGTITMEKLKLHPWLPIDATLLKPYTTDELLATVRKVLYATDRVARQTPPPSDRQDQPLAADRKISLQNCRSGKFMRCDSIWTADINEALNFLSVRRAVSFGMKELKDPFQVLQIGKNDPVGAVIITISNLPGSPHLVPKVNTTI